MTSPTTSNAQAKTGPVAKAFTIIILAVLFAAVIAFFVLPRPYDAIGTVVIYAGLVVGIATKLRTCLRLGQGSQYLSKLHGIAFWVVVGVFGVVPQLQALFTSQVRDYIGLGTKLCLCLALLYALELVVPLLERATAGSGLLVL
jgi:hypothetical protein